MFWFCLTVYLPAETLYHGINYDHIINISLLCNVVITLQSDTCLNLFNVIIGLVKDVIPWFNLGTYSCKCLCTLIPAHSLCMWFSMFFIWLLWLVQGEMGWAYSNKSPRQDDTVQFPTSRQWYSPWFHPQYPRWLQPHLWEYKGYQQYHSDISSYYWSI